MIFYFCYSISFKSLFLFILKAFYVGSISALSVFQNRKLQFTLIMKIEALCTSFSDFVFRLPSKHVAGDPVVRDCRKGKNFYCKYYSKSTTVIDCVEEKQKQGDSCLSLASLRALTVQKKKIWVTICPQSFLPVHLLSISYYSCKVYSSYITINLLGEAQLVYVLEKLRGKTHTFAYISRLGRK